MSLKQFWDDQAEAWGRFARTPGHDAYHEEFNFPAFLELVPPAGRLTLDLGCGEGRVGAALTRLGHSVVGVDSSPGMVAMARERHEAVVADAASLPFEDAAFDLIVAYMSVMNLDDPEAGIREAARVLEPSSIRSTAQVRSRAASSSFAGRTSSPRRSCGIRTEAGFGSRSSTVRCRSSGLLGRARTPAC